MRTRICSLFLLLSASSVWAGLPSNSTEIAKVVGTPTSIQVLPTEVNLSGPRATRQMLVTGQYADGSIRDLSPFVVMSAESSDLLDIQGSFIRAKKDGKTSLTLKVAGKELKVPVTIQQSQVKAISFRNEVIAGLNVGGCNMGACHGTPSGKNGFKLSLRGENPAQDYRHLTRDMVGRRVDRQNPLNSLLLMKGLGRVPHEGGARFGVDSLASESIEEWMAQGMPDDAPNTPTLKKIELLPGKRVALAPARWQQIAVLAHFSDGSVKDVTRLCNFSSSDGSIADVSATGLVEFKQAGEVAILVRYLEELSPVRLAYLEPREGFVWPNPPEVNYIDKHVFAKLKTLSIEPSGLCTDSEFLRRVYLDICGRLPTVEEATQFLNDADPAKRDKLVDQLLNRPEFADFWALKWADLLKANRKTIQVKGAAGLQQWLRDRIGKGEGLDSISRELLTASGSTHSNPAANYFRATKDTQSLAENTVQLFLGVRVQCAKCHNHPFESVTQDDYYSTAAWFTRVRFKKDPMNPGTPNKNPSDGAEVVYVARNGEVTQPRSGQIMKPKFLKAETPNIPEGADRREVFADWVVSPNNPYFSKAWVNRVWYHLFGKGIVDPVDDFRASNPPCNDELLDALAEDFAKNKFDLKKLIKTITQSRTYQLSSIPTPTNKDDQKYFSRCMPRLLTAEQMLDALCDVTGVAERFAGHPAGTRAVQLIDGEVNHPFLKAFGQPARELVCECERETESNLGQSLQLINGATVNDKLKNPNNRIGKLLEAKASDEKIVEEFFLAATSRKPTENEKGIILKHVASKPDRRKAWEDVLWAIINGRDFQFRQ